MIWDFNAKKMMMMMTTCAILYLYHLCNKEGSGKRGRYKDGIEGKNTEEKGRMNEGFQRLGIKYTPRSL